MIEFQGVSKTYPDGTTAVSELSLVVPSDLVTVIVGPSGCGKTTTLRMVNRMLEPSAGLILWDQEPLSTRPVTTLRRQMGYVIQSGGLFRTGRCWTTSAPCPHCSAGPRPRPGPGR